MGRELRRKQAKKEGKSLQKEEIKETNEIKKLLKITGILVFIGCMIYIISALFVTKELHWFGLNEEDTEETTTTVENTILASNIFKSQEETYYVYFYDFDGEVDDDITSTISNISDKVYKVNTSEGLNNNYISEGETGNKEAKSLDDLKVISPTLIKIVASEITEYYEGNEILNIK